MLTTHEKLSGRNHEKPKLKTTSGAAHSNALPMQRLPWDENVTDRKMPQAQGIRYTPTVQRAIIIPEELEGELVQSPGVAAKTPVDCFLAALGTYLHDLCKKMNENERNQVLPKEKLVYACSLALISLPAFDRRQIDTGYYINVLSHIPGYLFAEKDPDHSGEEDIPKIGELLALGSYVADYERDPSGISLFGYHRGAVGQPDFVREDATGKTVKKYDPQQLPRENTIAKSREWLAGAYDHHAGGKSTGAVCILDVSDATEVQLDNWISIFRNNLARIEAADITEENQSDLENDLIHLCNTYVASYKNARISKIKVLQGIFDEARAFLKSHPEWKQLEQWREEEDRQPDDMFGGLFD